MSFLSYIKNLFGRPEENSTQAGQGTTGEPSVPAHVAIIMDGNNRWAKQRGQGAGGGHRAGVEAIRAVLEVCQQQGIAVLTLFAFSSENWLRPESEVQELMKLLRNYLATEIDSLHKKGTRVRFIGRRDRLDADIVRLMQAAENKTTDNQAGTLVLAIDYGGRWDVAQAAAGLASQVAAGKLDAASIDESMLDAQMSLADLPTPDLCIRTGAEHRLSNFLLWQLSYAELYFCDCYWPDFDAREFNNALQVFASRQRRYGMSGQQPGVGNAPTAPRNGARFASMGRNA
ncbi:MAG: di-trans,poly-cis-decaprenylcistransferase [Gammaproteobacteria bacterium]|nr:di-trans,poly-cis-decaprenylcistransferase [Gammaproteobacteria bacterium]NND39466.1 di-trans,poly-cis-decaprenylcistransferase [Pseudomonadales bacterium]MBT8150552.1 di-trans,poly-cis-decaprenylcistransferase [Gammaproteobacteria bacterium]NNL10439.1 di-trans,poly-cis-decaprenylcistransferase [Pseudomonadales bacterium]NNM11918.1 di-trans,poly-cis-decaprenylcistransferase [Pseudomonadales bacterium]